MIDIGNNITKAYFNTSVESMSFLQESKMEIKYYLIRNYFACVLKKVFKNNLLIVGTNAVK